MPDPGLLARLRRARVVPVLRTTPAPHAGIAWRREPGLFGRCRLSQASSSAPAPCRTVRDALGLMET